MNEARHRSDDRPRNGGTAAAAGLRFCLVLPTGTEKLESGGGQRSAIFYRAMSSIAPTDVLVLSRADQGRREIPGFPGARLRYAATDGYQPRSTNPLRQGFRNVRKLLAIERFYRPSPDAARVVAEMGGADGYDLVVFRFFRSAACCADVDFGEACRKALDLDDRDDQKYTATLARRFGTSLPVRRFGAHVAGRIRRLFEWHFPAMSRIWVVDRSDVMAGGDVPWRVVPNVPFHTPATPPPPASTGTGLVFVGTAGHPPNLNGLKWFLRRVWPLIRAEMPDARLRVVGSGGWDRVDLSRLDLSGVEIVGRVDSIKAEYLRARASICPIFDGGGSKIKVIESCAFARPVICSPHSVRGFDGALAEALTVAADPASFARRCIEMLTDPGGADRAGARAMAAQRAAFSVESAVTQIRADIAEILDLASGDLRAKQAS